ncbi:methyltransferase domain-containing protein [Dactylosporangium sp. NPDC000555]|uniref:class I SAM-dependent methyltransferase n=1 Tax=Dactylosporangium sp. NPDC000555 TaxID=3154260 RepID=UPI00332DA1EF
MADDDLRVRRRSIFDEDPDNYHAARPGYPERVYEVLAECGLHPGAQVLEIGPGTGQVTGRLVAEGASVVAVELGAGLAARLRANLAGRDVTVVEGDFAAVELPSEGFDLAVCATALHWLDADVAVRRLAGLIRPGGWLAVWWTVFGDPDRTPAWRADLQELYRRWMPDEVRDPAEMPAPMRVGDRTAELAAGGWFGPVHVELIRWDNPLTPAAARALWATFPNVRELDPARREGFLDDVAEIIVCQPGGSVVDHYVTALYTAERQPDTALQRSVDESPGQADLLGWLQGADA